MLIYTILVMNSPYNTENSSSALNFSKILMHNQDYQIKNVFFYGNGVLNANNMMCLEQKNINLLYHWYKFSKKFSIKLYICSNSAQERGIISDKIGKENGFFHGNLHQYFQITGLGTLIQTILVSDRLLQF